MTHAPRSPQCLPRRLAAVLLALPVAGCDDGDRGSAAPTGMHDEPADLLPVDHEKFDGPLARFDADLIFDDAMFTNVAAVDATGVQSLFEATPYGGRSFLADERLGGVPASQVFVDVAHSRGLNPIVLLASVQVSASLVSQTSRPDAATVDFALGCGCVDEGQCNALHRGLEAQLVCGADTLRQHFDASVVGTGMWRSGVARTTLDPQLVTPRSHGTAALYARTPWVLEDRGGNWLVWNISRKYIGALLDRDLWGTVDDPSDPDGPIAGSCEDHCGSTSAVPKGDGESCFCDPGCGASGDCCDDFALFCDGDPTDGDPTDGDPTDGDPTDGDPTDGERGSCVGVCATQDPVDDGDGTQCFCDPTCTLSGDCCSDYEAVCESEMPGGSCAGACGGTDPVDAGDGTTCWCDVLCGDNGDCCGDYDAQCG